MLSRKIKNIIYGVVFGVTLPFVIRGDYGYPLGILLLTLVLIIINLKTED